MSDELTDIQRKIRDEAGLNQQTLENAGWNYEEATAAKKQLEEAGRQKGYNPREWWAILSRVSAKNGVQNLQVLADEALRANVAGQRLAEEQEREDAGAVQRIAGDTLATVSEFADTASAGLSKKISEGTAGLVRGLGGLAAGKDFLDEAGAGIEEVKRGQQQLVEEAESTLPGKVAVNVGRVVGFLMPAGQVSKAGNALRAGNTSRKAKVFGTLMGGAKPGAAPGLLSRVSMSANNFAATTVLMETARIANEQGIDLAQGNITWDEFKARASEELARLPGEAATSYATGALMPFFQKMAQGLERGVLGKLGAQAEGKTMAEIFKTLGAKGGSQAMLARTVGGVEFLPFAMLNNQFNADGEFTGGLHVWYDALWSDDEEAKANAREELLVNFFTGIAMAHRPGQPFENVTPRGKRQLIKTRSTEMDDKILGEAEAAAQDSDAADPVKATRLSPQKEAAIREEIRKALGKMPDAEMDAIDTDLTRVAQFADTVRAARGDTGQPIMEVVSERALEGIEAPKDEYEALVARQEGAAKEMEIALQRGDTEAATDARRRLDEIETEFATLAEKQETGPKVAQDRSEFSRVRRQYEEAVQLIDAIERMPDIEQARELLRAAYSRNEVLRNTIGEQEMLRATIGSDLPSQVPAIRGALEVMGEQLASAEAGLRQREAAVESKQEADFQETVGKAQDEAAKKADAEAKELFKTEQEKAEAEKAKTQPKPKKINPTRKKKTAAEREAQQKRIIKKSRQQTKKKEDEKRKAEKQLVTDELTGLPNRRAWEGAKKRVEGDADTDVLFADLGNFKNLNDTKGFAAGDKALKAAARDIQAAARQVGIPARSVFRLGGDEFVVSGTRDQIQALSELLAGRRVPGTPLLKKIPVVFDTGTGPTLDFAEKRGKEFKAERKAKAGIGSREEVEQQLQETKGADDPADVIPDVKRLVKTKGEKKDKPKTEPKPKAEPRNATEEDSSVPAPPPKGDDGQTDSPKPTSSQVDVTPAERTKAQKEADAEREAIDKQQEQMRVEAEELEAALRGELDAPLPYEVAEIKKQVKQLAATARQIRIEQGQKQTIPEPVVGDFVTVVTPGGTVRGIVTKVPDAPTKKLVRTGKALPGRRIEIVDPETLKKNRVRITDIQDVAFEQVGDLKLFGPETINDLKAAAKARGGFVEITADQFESLSNTYVPPVGTRVQAPKGTGRTSDSEARVSRLVTGQDLDKPFPITTEGGKKVTGDAARAAEVEATARDNRFSKDAAQPQDFLLEAISLLQPASIRNRTAGRAIDAEVQPGVPGTAEGAGSRPGKSKLTTKMERGDAEDRSLLPDSGDKETQLWLENESGSHWYDPRRAEAVDYFDPEARAKAEAELKESDPQLYGRYMKMRAQAERTAGLHEAYRDAASQGKLRRMGFALVDRGDLPTKVGDEFMIALRGRDTSGHIQDRMFFSGTITPEGTVLLRHLKGAVEQARWLREHGQPDADAHELAKEQANKLRQMQQDHSSLLADDHLAKLIEGRLLTGKQAIEGSPKSMMDAGFPKEDYLLLQEKGIEKALPTLVARMAERMNTRMDPITGRPIRKAANGDWIVKGPKKEHDLVLGARFLPITGRQALDFLRLGGRVMRTAWDVADGLIDGTVEGVRQIVGEPLKVLTLEQHRLADWIPALEGRREALEGFSSRVRRTLFQDDPDGGIKAELNRDRGESQFIDHEVVRIIEPFAKLTAEKQLEILIDHHDKGKTHPILREYQAEMDRLGQRLVDLGLLDAKQFDRWKGRYVHFGRWMHTAEAIDKKTAQLKSQISKMNQDMRAMAAEGKPVTGMQAQINQLNAQLKAVKAKRQGLFRLRESVETRGFPIDGISQGDVKAFRARGFGKKKGFETMQDAIESGLDVREPWRLLFDGLRHEWQAVRQAEWFADQAKADQFVKNAEDAPAHWVEVSSLEKASDPVWRPLVGKKIHPQMYDWLKANEPTQSAVMDLYDHVHSSVKMALTMGNPSNWVTQMIGNPLIMAGMDVPMYRVHQRYAQGLQAVFGKGDFGKRLEFYRRTKNWVDQPTDVDREFLRFMEQEIGDDPFSGNFKAIWENMLADAQGSVWDKAKAGTKGADRSARHIAKMISRYYRYLDAAARIGTYEELRFQGKSDAEATKMVNDAFDLANISGFGRFARRSPAGVFFGDSFISIKAALARNFWGMTKGTAKVSLATMAVAQVWNAVMAQVMGTDKESIDDEIAASVPAYNPFTHWWDRNTTFHMGPSGTLDTRRWMPSGPMLDYIPGTTQAVESMLGGVDVDSRGQTLDAELVSRFFGGNTVGIGAAWEYALDRDQYGQPGVRRRYETPGTMGTTGLPRVLMDNGFLPALGTNAVTRTLLGRPSQFRSAIMAGGSQLAGRRQHARERLEPWVSGKDLIDNNGFTMVGPEVEPPKLQTEQDFLLRVLGFRLNQPDALRREQEKLVSTPGTKRALFGRTVEGELRQAPNTPDAARARAAVSKDDELQRTRRALSLWGHVATLEQAQDTKEQERILKLIRRRWPDQKTISRDVKHLIRMKQGIRAEELRRVLVAFKLLDPETRPIPARALIRRLNKK